MFTSLFTTARCHRDTVSRRSFLRTISAGAIASGVLSFSDLMAVQAEELRRQGKSMILLWMSGGPSQFETFDPKPDHENGAGTKVITTAVPGIQIAEGWENTAKVMKEIALIRSMTNKEGNHQRASYQLHTGYVPTGSVKHPGFGSNIAKELADPNHDLPAVVSIGRTEGLGGYLGVDYEPFVVDNPGSLPNNVGTTVAQSRLTRRLEHLKKLESDFASRGGQVVVDNQQKIYDKASRLVLSPLTKAFDVSEEPADLQKQYGDSSFGKGCLLARRLIEKGVTFVEVRSNGWDTHDDVHSRVTTLAQQVDPGFGTLIQDLKDKGMLENTVVAWMGEFGRTPKVNPRDGRDHYPRVFNAAVAGGGIKGGQVIGKSSADGSAIDDRPVTPPDLFSSICKALEVNPAKESISPLGRPMKIVDGGEVVKELFS
jgi:uncharacterized protein (DUF1501 family)